MRIFKALALLFICFSLTTGGFANAAMKCCAQSDMATHMADNNNTSMPCHKSMSGKQDNHFKTCEACKTCINISAVLSYNFSYTPAFANITHIMPVNNFLSVEPTGFYTPPVSIS